LHELGPLKISFAGNLDRTVGAPSAAVAGVLTGLSPHDMEILIAHGAGTGRPICTALRRDLPTPTPPDARAEFYSYQHLIEAGLVETRGAAESDDPWCTRAGLRTAWLTDAGTAARRYLIDLLTRSLVIRAG
jgi:hypothetical protein